MSGPRVAAIVLNWCNEAVTRECLRSLEESEYDSLELLLVDNGSPDGSGGRLREAFPGVHFLQTGANLGYTGGNNRGIEWALAREVDFVLILNNDVVLQPGAITRMVEAAEGAGSKVGGVVPKILFHHDPDRIWYGGGEFSPLRGLGLHWKEGELDGNDAPEETRDVTFMTGACCLLSTSALREVGGFDEAFFAYTEDAEISLRLLKSGFRILYQPQARVLHHSPPPGTPPTPFQIRQRDRNRRRVMRIHFPLSARIPFLLRFYLSRAVLFSGYLLARDWARAGAIIHGMRPG